MAEGASSRCATHPARPSIDHCPVCTRSRCGADVAMYGATGCPACYRVSVEAGPDVRELIVRAGLAGYAVAVVGGWIGTQYVRESVFSLLLPGLVGLAAGGATSAAAGSLARRYRVAIAVGAAVASAGLAFALTPGGQNPLRPAGTVLPPYLAAVIGVIAWPVLFGTPRRHRAGQPPEASIDR